jgi:hypothetical protein
VRNSADLHEHFGEPVTGFCCGIAVGAIVVAVALAVGAHVLLELADGRLAAW